MRRVHRTSDEDRGAVEAWLKRHSGARRYGEQCTEHPPVRKLTHKQLTELLGAELGFAPSRPWLVKLCAELRISRRRRDGPDPIPPKERKAIEKARYDAWVAKLKRDPEKFRAWMDKQNERRRARRAARKAAA